MTPLPTASARCDDLAAYDRAVESFAAGAKAAPRRKVA